jgi:two-component system nitrogen regulation sensor histidine kinase NtrY
VIKNAAEAIEAVPDGALGKGKITLRGRLRADAIIVDVIDNGKGLPEENRHRLLEPYMTTRSKGTGLGLAIVGKILEEHGGHIELLDSPEVARGGRGAMMRLVLPAHHRDLPDAQPARVKDNKTNIVTADSEAVTADRVMETKNGV